MAVMDPAPPLPAGAWAQQFFRDSIFSPAPYLGIGHLVGGSFSGEM